MSSNHNPPVIGMIGLGNLGTAIGNLVAAKGIPVLGWEYNSAVVDEINRDHTNSRYLPGIPLEPALAATTDISAVLESCRIVFIALPSAFIQSTLRPVRQAAQADSILVNMAKGIDGETGLTAFQTLTALFPSHPRVMLSGPTIANEFARGMPTVVVLAGENRADLMAVSQVLGHPPLPHAFLRGYDRRRVRRLAQEHLRHRPGHLRRQGDHQRQLPCGLLDDRFGGNEPDRRRPGRPA